MVPIKKGESASNISGNSVNSLPANDHVSTASNPASSCRSLSCAMIPGWTQKEQTASYHAEATDTCDFGHESKPWSALLYTIKYQISKHMRDDAKKSKLL